VSVDSAMRELRPKMAKHVNRRAEMLRSEEYDTLERSRVGRGIHWPGNRNPSSAPGDPPARQTGRLQESIAITKRATQAEPYALVGPRPQAFSGSAPYPVFLEYGTRHIAPRPFVRPSVSQLKRALQ